MSIEHEAQGKDSWTSSIQRMPLWFEQLTHEFDESKVQKHTARREYFERARYFFLILGLVVYGSFKMIIWVEAGDLANLQVQHTESPLRFGKDKNSAVMVCVRDTEYSLNLLHMQAGTHTKGAHTNDDGAKILHTAKRIKRPFNLTMAFDAIQDPYQFESYCKKEYPKSSVSFGSLISDEEWEELYANNTLYYEYYYAFWNEENVLLESISNPCFDCYALPGHILQSSQDSIQLTFTMADRGHRFKALPGFWAVFDSTLLADDYALDRYMFAEDSTRIMENIFYPCSITRANVALHTIEHPERPTYIEYRLQSVTSHHVSGCSMFQTPRPKFVIVPDQRGMMYRQGYQWPQDNFYDVLSAVGGMGATLNAVIAVAVGLLIKFYAPAHKDREYLLKLRNHLHYISMTDVEKEAKNQGVRHMVSSLEAKVKTSKKTKEDGVSISDSVAEVTAERKKLLAEVAAEREALWASVAAEREKLLADVRQEQKELRAAVLADLRTELIASNVNATTFEQISRI